MATKAEIRARVFSAENTTRKKINLTFFGAEIELRQPTAGDILRYMESDARSLNLISVLLDYAYVPGTDDKVFEEGDVETLKQLPFNEDMQKLTKAIEEFTNVMVGQAEKN